MKPGEIYEIYFPYPPGHVDNQGRTGKNRPAIIMSTDSGQAIAVAVKITGSSPTSHFPHRIPIMNWRTAKLDKGSWAEISTYQAITLNSKLSPRGIMHHLDFKNVVRAFKTLHGV